MFCDEVLDVIEPIAAGELTPDGRIAAHLASCPDCAAALESARQLERLLKARPVPAPPQQFTARTLARVRRDRWRRDQVLDLGFNTAIGAVALGIIAGGWLLLARSRLVSVSDETGELMRNAARTLVDRIAPYVPLYAGAAALLVAAIGIWWWAERAES